MATSESYVTTFKNFAKQRRIFLLTERIKPKSLNKKVGAKTQLRTKIKFRFETLTQSPQIYEHIRVNLRVQCTKVHKAITQCT